MATATNVFECYIPVAVSGTPQDSNIQTFFSNMMSLNSCEQDTCYLNSANAQVYSYHLETWLTNTQVTTALGYVSTLNTALGTPVICIIVSGTSEP